ncbi:hypothetical protein [Protaetiibacter intestinalis]|uniref:Uncharacterized protein n=1 Tax=Protaetiibacter intestinalis TaxID=2419774 RepID=A0A387B6S2_9MICO|nr:hypothetical protein [Protaetiibacter intestinalis]AYF96809.1 hypothetical protein D7I47_00085 [Protaetiibacter intestinalis]
MTTTTTSPRSRSLVALLATLLLAVALAGCSLIPSLPTGGGGTDTGTNGGSDDGGESELVGTTWSGTDSDGDTWTLEFQEDGTVGLTYDGNSFDDGTDTWSESGGTLTVHIEFSDGPVELTGAFLGLDQPIETQGSYTGGSFTLTLTRD